VDVLDCRPFEPRDEQRALRSYAPGLFAWVVGNARVFKTFIPARRRLGFFDVEIPARWLR
jgi:hypothetical protein